MQFNQPYIIRIMLLHRILVYIEHANHKIAHHRNSYSTIHGMHYQMIEHSKLL